jgi:2,4-dienoyl-CoA reductase-like NADH-dependent reductase (Old Yellow Enzyme family)
MRETGIATGAVGMINDARFAETILEENRADLIVIARMALWDPYWPHHAAKALGVKVNLPIQYARADIF